MTHQALTTSSPIREKPWLFRTYSGHSSALESNKLFRTNLGKGQTGLSVAFDLPTQTGYDSDHHLARGEVGKVGVPVCHLGDMMALFDQIPLSKMNTSMTINAPAAWLLSLYIAAAEKQGTARSTLSGTTQNDIIKEYLSRGTYIFPPKPSLKLTSDIIAFTYKEIPKWNPINVCSYHLQEAGATPEQELAFALAAAIAVLDSVRNSNQVPESDFPRVVGRISFFVNAGIRFVTELCKMRAFQELWDEICQKRYDIQEEKYRQFRYGMQVNSLGLTEQQPENNVYRILLEMLSVVLSKKTRARAIQLPAWNEALGLPRPWDQQWSLRLQQIVAYETDILEYGDIFDGSKEILSKVDELKSHAREELVKIESIGGAVSAIDSSYMKQKLVESNVQRMNMIESNQQIVVGVNKFIETENSPLTTGNDMILTVDPLAEKEQIQRLESWRIHRALDKVNTALTSLKLAAREGRNIMEPSIVCAHAGVTGGEWAQVLREIYGEYRAPTGVSYVSVTRVKKSSSDGSDDIDRIRSKVDSVSTRIGRRVKILIGKPGLDGHSNGAEQIAVRARDAGMEVVYEGIRLTPAQIANTALEEGVHVVGLSILSGSHVSLVKEVISLMRTAGLSHIPVIVGGIIPQDDEEALYSAGVARIYTPKDYDLSVVMNEIVELVVRQQPNN